MKYYLAGPMAGHPEHNWPYFKKITAYLRVRGYDIACPTESGGKEELGYVTSLKLSLIHLLQCDAIIMLPGWSSSRGATLELLLAVLLDYRIMKLQESDEAEGVYQLWKFDYYIPQALAQLLHAWKIPFKLIPL